MRSGLPATLLLAAGAVAMAPSSAAAAGQPFTCEASVLRGTILVAPPIEPLVANRGAACANASAGLPSLPAPLPVLKAGALTAATQRTGDANRSDLQQNLAAAVVGDLSAGSLGSLGLALPLDAIALPPSAAIPPINIAPIATALNTADVLNRIPDLPNQLTIDVQAAVKDLLKLPTADLLAIKSASALAGASCVDGKPVTAGQRTVGGVTVLGTPVDVDTFGDRPIVDTQTIDPSAIDLTKVKVPVIDSLLPFSANPLVPPVIAQLRALVATAVRALPPISVPITLAQVSVKPGTQVKTADSLTQTALEVKIAALGQNVVDLVLAEAKVGTAGVDCAPPPTAAVAKPAPVEAVPGPAIAGQTALACTTRSLVLTDVLRRGSRVTITGVADKRFVGRSVTIKFEADGRTAGHALVAPNGTFQTTAPLPSRRLRSSNRARYQAVLGTEKSLNLKLERRMYVDRLTSENGKVTVAGRVTRPLGRPVQTITLTRRVSCRDSEVVARFKPTAAGRFSITVDAPKGLTSAVYRLGTKVRKTQRNKKLYPTFTLPRGVDLVQ